MEKKEKEKRTRHKYENNKKAKVKTHQPSKKEKPTFFCFLFFLFFRHQYLLIANKRYNTFASSNREQRSVKPIISAESTSDDGSTI
jgi:hypothetical protein